MGKNNLANDTISIVPVNDLERLGIDPLIAFAELGNGLVAVPLADGILGDDVRLGQEITLPDYKVPVQNAQGSTGNTATAGARSTTPSAVVPANPATPQRNDTTPDSRKKTPANPSLETRIASQSDGSGMLSNGHRLPDDEVLRSTYLRLAERYNIQL